MIKSPVLTKKHGGGFLHRLFVAGRQGVAKSVRPFWFQVGIPGMLQVLAWPFAVLLLFVFARFRVEGRENLRRLPRGVIFAANHHSQLDPILMRAALPWLSKYVSLFYVARQSSVYDWTGWRALVYGDAFFKAWGAYPAFKGEKNYGSALRHFVSICSAGYPVAIFPTGIQHASLTEVRVHGGVGYLALTTGNPVVPVTIEGSEHLTMKNFFRREYNIRVRIGEPIMFQKMNFEVTVDECKAPALQIWEKIYKMQKESASKV